MDRFYFVRHGETDANNQGLMCGRLWNIELNETGIAQARMAADLLAKEKELGALWSSSMIRAQQTAEILNLRLNLPLTFHQDLEEWNVGGWDRLKWSEVKQDFLSNGEPPGGELRKDFRARINRALTLCLNSPIAIVLVAHGGVWLAIQQILGIEPVRAPNGSVFSCQRPNPAANSWFMSYHLLSETIRYQPGRIRPPTNHKP